MRTCIFGAAGGIGSAIALQLAQRDSVGEVHVGARTLLVAQHPKVKPFTFDLTDEQSIADAAARIGGSVDIVIVATGILHDASGMKPEKSLRALGADTMASVFAINAIGPALIAKHMLPLLHRDRRSVFAALSARVGSIEDNRLGGWHSYRASKAALNMLVRNFAIELATRNHNAIAVTLHPGTVVTGLSEPFQRAVPEDQLFTPETSARYLLSVLESLTPADSGRLFAWDGQRIPF
jgi:NAD(P)-dependent dehydrogenase (short-subunit alcohol dehydrogenase family)